MNTVPIILVLKFVLFIFLDDNLGLSSLINTLYVESGSTDSSEETTSPVPQPPVEVSSTAPPTLVTKSVEGAEADTQTVSVDWLIRRLGKVATFEATNSPRSSIKVMNVIG